MEGNVAVTKDEVDVLTAYPLALRSLAEGNKGIKAVTSPVNSTHLHKRRNS